MLQGARETAPQAANGAAGCQTAAARGSQWVLSAGPGARSQVSAASGGVGEPKIAAAMGVGLSLSIGFFGPVAMRLESLPLLVRKLERRDALLGRIAFDITLARQILRSQTISPLKHDGTRVTVQEPLLHLFT